MPHEHDGVIKQAMTDRQQWALFIGHLVLGLIVLGPILYFSARALAANEATKAAADVSEKVEEVRVLQNEVRERQATFAADIANIKTELGRLSQGQQTIDSKLDKIIDRQLDAAARVR